MSSGSLYLLKTTSSPSRVGVSLSHSGSFLPPGRSGPVAIVRSGSGSPVAAT